MKSFDLVAACVADMEEVGYSVPPIEADTSECDWSYTIGLHRTFDHPELILIGLDAPLAGAVLEYLCQQVVDGVAFAPGATTGSAPCDSDFVPWTASFAATANGSASAASSSRDTERRGLPRCRSCGRTAMVTTRSVPAIRPGCFVSRCSPRSERAPRSAGLTDRDPRCVSRRGVWVGRPPGGILSGCSDRALRAPTARPTLAPLPSAASEDSNQCLSMSVTASCTPTTGPP